MNKVSLVFLVQICLTWSGPAENFATDLTAVVELYIYRVNPFLPLRDTGEPRALSALNHQI